MSDRCKKHQRRNCADAVCRTRDTSTASSGDALTDPLSPLHQAVYGGAFYGTMSGDTSPSCDSNSSPYDSGSPSGCDTSSSGSSGGDW